jgi:hypothetical protein
MALALVLTALLFSSGSAASAARRERDRTHRAARVRRDIDDRLEGARRDSLPGNARFQQMIAALR